MAISMKMARVGADLTQQQVADKMGIHVQTYSKMESNSEIISFHCFYPTLHATSHS